ncbi:prohead scaffolding protein [Serratia phage Muldoon]|uniref:Prohead scaffolding protein n=1 Tax=Serratia phage Muldoon TaxID=2601678 RepID=A0A5P8PHF0_9CAUD|nr:prohead scaffolding protein [Serratia phage Muldoon]QFR56126.1 prohead scaffolding protein [Serratia phage Muldoon]WDS61717.1 prohead assembly (scaffolding) protein [Cronobacter phage vB_Cdu_VP8]
MAEQLLIEHWGQPGEFVDGQPMLESKSSESGALYIEGIFLQAEVVNRNKRLYPKAVLEKAVADYVRTQVNTKQALGELNHPPRAMVDPMQAAIIIEKLEWKGNNVVGRARIIEGDGGAGDKLAALIRAGWVPGVSSRGLGSVKDSGRGYNIVQENFRLTVGVDVVWGPSAPDAMVKAVTESVEQPKLEESAEEAFALLADRLKAL